MDNYPMNTVLKDRITFWFNQIVKDQEELGQDPFGLDPSRIKFSVPAIDFLYNKYFRVQVHGISNIPSRNALFVGNHSGQVPFDAMMVTAALMFEMNPPVLLRSMLEKWVPTLPFVSEFFSAWGQATGTPENFRILMERGESILVFPEGIKGISKTIFEKYRLKKFPTGFYELASEFKVPIIPTAVIGAEEQFPSIYNLKSIGKIFGAPGLPITPFFPILGPMGMLPLPVKYHIYFGPPIYPENVDENLEINVKKVQEKIQVLINRGLAEREGYFT
jgi:1-acyl-sn-glycerol-3-phosphate acyltransferase